MFFSGHLYDLWPGLWQMKHMISANLADATYERVPMHEDESAGAQVNALELIQDPNQNSEEPKASSAQEGKPRCI